MPELAGGYKMKAVVLHDAEDSVHADELHIYDRLIEKCLAVQLPVIPIRVKGSTWISGHYCDEFAEAHGKTLVVREALGASLPLAGVGCAIDRNFLGRVALESDDGPFDCGSLTEDYELGLRVGAYGGRVILARILDSTGQLVGTRACFPDTLDASVRQKSRWLTGIALAGWDRWGWRGTIAEKWMLLRDRRSIIAAIILLAAYVSIILTAILAVGSAAGLYEAKAMPTTLTMMLQITLLFLLWRMVVRALFVGAQYGLLEAVLSVPRGVIANIVAIMAARRACVAYVKHCMGKPLVWEKTFHHVVPEQAVRIDRG